MSNPTSTALRAVCLARRKLVHSVGLLLVLVITGFGCSPGGSDPGEVVAAPSITCSAPGTFCMVSCNLGCTSGGGCSILDVPTNRDLVFEFSAPIDPASVDKETAQLRGGGSTPAAGQWYVDGSTLRFVPQMITVEGQISFGLVAGETYKVLVRGVDSGLSGLRATDGRALGDSLQCVVRASLGMVDGNGTAPVALLSQPSSPLNAPLGTTIAFEFDERLDPNPFVNATPGNEPIRLSLRGTQAAPGLPGVRLCDPNGDLVELDAQLQLINDPVQDRATVTITPSGALPPVSCVQIEITDLVLDLVGTAAIPATFEFVTEDDLGGAPAIVFDFEDSQFLDDESSASTWSGGFARFAKVGGDGSLGSFDPTDGNEVEPGVFAFNTDSQMISAKDDALLDVPTEVTDGIFRFSRFEIPVGTTVRFFGSQPAQILVRGDAQIDGVLDLNGSDAEVTHDGRQFRGQPGADGGAGGGRGGDGAFAGTNDGNQSQPQFNDFNGFDGESLQIQGGSPFATHAGATGGRGGTMHPPGNDLTVVQSNPPPSFFPSQTDYIGGFAGGAGFLSTGGIGEVRAAQSALTTGNSPNFRGADGDAGDPMLALIAAAQAGFGPSFDSRLTLLIGGAGGGGAGSHPFVSNLIMPSYWSGGGGAGGGGALGLYVGDDLTMGLAGGIEARGGSTTSLAPLTLSPVNGFPASGGAGSGGSILLQVSGDVALAGQLDAVGGDGAHILVMPGGGPCFPNVPCIGFVDASSGDGGIGLVRLETEGRIPAPTELGAVAPVATTYNVGELLDSDEVVGFQTRFVAAGATAPTYLRYVVDAIVDGVPMRFSDDPNLGPQATAGQPVQFWVQGQDVDPGTFEPVFGSQPSPFRQLVGATGASPSLQQDGRNGFRVLILADRSLANGPILIDRVRVEFQ